VSRVLDSRDVGAFIPAALDDYPLTVVEFRVYCRTVRRAGADGCYESHDAMGKAVGVSSATVKRARRLLEKAGLVTVERRVGRTSTYRLTPVEQWVEREEVSLLRGPTLVTDDPGHEKPRSPQTPDPGHESTETQVTTDPLRFSQEGSPTKEDVADPVHLVFAAWLDATGKHPTRTKLDGKRRRLIKQALRDYPVGDLVETVRGWQHSSWHRGENQNRVAYNGLDLLLRNAEKIEFFRDLERQSLDSHASRRQRCSGCGRLYVREPDCSTCHPELLAGVP